MQNMKRTLVIFILIGMGCNFQSQENNIDKSAVTLINSFFKGLEAKEVNSTLDNLLGSNPNINLTDSTSIHLKNSFVLINEASGSYKGYLLLKKKYIEDVIGIYSYLAKYEKKFYRFVFMFYNNGNSVKLYKFLFDDNLDVELEESLKYYLN